MSNESIHKKLSPFMVDYIRQLFDEFEKEKIIEKIVNTKEENKEQKYCLAAYAKEQAPVQTSSSTAPVQKDHVQQLTELRTIANNIYYDFFPLSNSNNSRPTYKQMLYKLSDQKMLTMNWERRDELLDIIDKLDSLGNDPETKKDVESIIESSKININKTIHDLLEQFAAQKISIFFKSKQYSQTAFDSNKIDLVLENPTAVIQKLLFEVKFRRRNPLPDKKLLLQSLGHLMDMGIGRKVFLVILVFTNDNQGTFEKYKFQFARLLEDVDGYDLQKKQIQFLPISTTNFSQIDTAMEDFSNAYIGQNINFRFRNQEAPKGFPERNDHILEKNFRFKNTNFKISVSPNNTQFWRLGFTFSKTDTFPKLTEGRHEDSDYIFVHLCVGDEKNLVWNTPNMLKVNTYPDGFKKLKDTLEMISDYKGEEVIFTLNSNEDGSETVFSVTTRQKSLGSQTLDLSQFQFCRISAWCDIMNFDLDTTIEVNYKM